MKKLLLGIFMLSITATISYAQDFKMPAPSPIQTITQQFSTSAIEISYSRPSLKGRTAFGDLVPFDKMWRTGANGATTITFKEDVSIDGNQIPSGTYAVYAIPNPETWIIIFNKGHKNWGLSGYKEEENIATIKAPVKKVENKIETFTISIDNMSSKSATISMGWEHFVASFEVVADNHKRILQHLEKELKGEKPPYQQAANYYLENNYQLADAIKYADKAIAANKDAFWLHWLKARIYAKMGKSQDAIAAATTAANMAKGTDYEGEYANNLLKMMNELK